MRPVDPRIHFALNCGAASCPAIRVYSAANLEAGLASATSAFVAGEVSVDESSREVRLSKIFKWYRPDFVGFGGDDAALLRYVAPYLPERDAAALARMLGDGGGKVKVAYKEYDWTSNAKK